MKAIVALRKEEREHVNKRIERQRLRNQLHHLKDDLRDEEEEERPKKKARRLENPSYDHVMTMRITGQGYLQVSNNMCKKELSKDDGLLLQLSTHKLDTKKTQAT
eukprot:13100981-Ditylum_brightwellii.AAC.1